MCDKLFPSLYHALPNESSSLKQLLHYLQLVETPGYTLYDYGSKYENIYHYQDNGDVPKIPLQDISKPPIVMLWGLDDKWAPAEDAEALSK